MANNDYYIGLDVGINSIGWAVTDLDYHVLKFRSNAMWGIRLFEESKTAEERRGFRNTRRRLERARFRRQCLEMIFDKEISKVDVSFFQRLKESNLYLEDKTVNYKDALFHDELLSDKKYHKMYPTIYHLRKDLIDNPEPHDIRLVFLALSHIIKNRGHFLFADEFTNNSDQMFDNVWNEYAAYCEANYDVNLYTNRYLEIEEVLKNQHLSKKNQEKELIEILECNKKDKRKMAFISLIVGASVSANVLFADDDLKNVKSKKLSIDSGYDDRREEYENDLAERIELLDMAKAVHNWAVLSNIMFNQKYISSARIIIYEKHKADLKLLKEFVKTYLPNKYQEIFNDNIATKNNYVAYSKHTKASKEAKTCSQEAFCEYVKKLLPEVCPEEKYLTMYEELELKTFMPKIVSANNVVIPAQVNREELKAILENAKAYLPFLNESDADGKTNAQKIIDIFNYRIPYYVGPLNKHSEKSWLVRTDEKIYPWNIDKVVDFDLTSEHFIEVLTSKCSYLYKEDVLPKFSLAYSTFMVLNELNNVRVNGELLPVITKQQVYENLFMKYAKVTEKQFIIYLRELGYINPTVSGINKAFVANLKPYIDLKNIQLSLKDKEEVIKTITIFGDDKKMLKKRLKDKFKASLSENEIDRLSNLKYKNWGRVSKKFLIGIEAMVAESGEITNILNAMWNTQYTLTQLLSEPNTFNDEIENENKAISFDLLKNEIDDLYVSPSAKRTINQAMKIVEEIVKIRKAEPKRIFINFNREKGEKIKAPSRKNRLLELYRPLKKKEAELYKRLEDTNESELKRNALYLYFLQMGRCMYTKEIIDFDKLFDKNVYDIDHIYPQSKIIDDSFDNRVLVKKEANRLKNNNFPLDVNIRKNNQSYWQELLTLGLISHKKYERLIRNTALNYNELSEHINRQLIDSRQSTKAISSLLKRHYEQSEIVHVKEQWVNKFRAKEDMLKCREVNDYYHAKDAYLNIVVGNVYNSQFNHNKFNFIQGLIENKYSVDKLFYFDIEGIWQAQENQSMELVKKQMLKNNILYTRYAFKKKDGLFKVTLQKKGAGQIPIKGDNKHQDINKYGGYTSPTANHFAIISYINRRKARIKRIVPINLLDEREYVLNPKAYIFKAMKEIDGYESDINSIEVLIPELKVQSLFSIDGCRMHLSCKSNRGKSVKLRIAEQLVLGYENEKYIKKLAKCNDEYDLYLFEYLVKDDDIYHSLNKEDKFNYLTSIVKNKNLELCDLLAHKLTKTVFKVKLSAYGNVLINNRDKFESLDFIEQFKVILEVLRFMHADASYGNLTAIGGNAISGIISIFCTINGEVGQDSFKIINQSITGLYEQEIELIN